MMVIACDSWYPYLKGICIYRGYLNINRIFRSWQGSSDRAKHKQGPAWIISAHVRFQHSQVRRHPHLKATVTHGAARGDGDIARLSRALPDSMRAKKQNRNWPFVPCHSVSTYKIKFPKPPSSSHIPRTIFGLRQPSTERPRIDVRPRRRSHARM